MTVRAKFKCESVADSQDITKQIRLTVVTDGSEDNKRFFKWTPTGSITLGTVNEEAAKQFVVGTEYYVDFIRLATLLLALLFCAPVMAQCTNCGAVAVQAQSYGSTGSYAASSYASSGSAAAVRSGGSTGGYAMSSYGGGSGYSGSMSFAELRRHVRQDHGISVAGLSYDQLVAIHESAHANEARRPRRGLFGWRW